MVLFNPLYIRNDKSYVKSDGIYLKALWKTNPIKKIPSKSDEEKIYTYHVNIPILVPFSPFN